MDIRIIREEKSWIAVYKPAGLAVQTGKVGEADLESELKKLLAGRRRPSAKNREGHPPYLAVIHRLDQPVEGIVLFARTPRAAAALSAQLQQRKMEKEYLACVRLPAGIHTETGTDSPAEQQWHRLCDWLVRDRKNNSSRISAAGTREAKKCELDYRIISESDGRAVLGIRLYTGRHHQIRVQLAHAGMPIVGDAKYGGGCRPAEGAADTTHTDRFPALCARRLSFTDPDRGDHIVLEVKPAHRLLFNII